MINYEKIYELLNIKPDEQWNYRYNNSPGFNSDLITAYVKYKEEIWDIGEDGFNIQIKKESVSNCVKDVIELSFYFNDTDHQEIIKKYNLNDEIIKLHEQVRKVYIDILENLSEYSFSNLHITYNIFKYDGDKNDIEEYILNPHEDEHLLTLHLGSNQHNLYFHDGENYRYYSDVSLYPILYGQKFNEIYDHVKPTIHGIKFKHDDVMPRYSIVADLFGDYEKIT